MTCRTVKGGLSAKGGGGIWSPRVASDRPRRIRSRRIGLRVAAHVAGGAQRVTAAGTAHAGRELALRAAAV